MGNGGMIRKGTNRGLLVFGLAFIAAGLLFFGMAFFGNYTLRFHGVVLPGWSMYVITAILTIAGIGTIQSAVNSWKCAFCGTPLQHGEAYYPADYEREVKWAIESQDASQLEKVPPFKDGHGCVTMSIDYCDRCGRVGVISLEKSMRAGERIKLIKPIIVSAEGLGAFLPFVKSAPRISPLAVDE